MTITELIIEKVSNGIKLINLIVDKDILALPISHDDIITEIDRLIAVGEIVEIEYILPNLSPRRIKTFLLPKGTEVKARNAVGWKQEYTPRTIESL